MCRPSSIAAGPPLTLGDLVRPGKRESVLAAITSPDVDVNAKAPDGSTALMWAIFNVDRELVRALLKAGAKADVTNSYGATALAEAVKVEDIELVRMLLDAGADVNSPNLDNQTALMLAVSIGSLPISKLLVERGADVNAVETFRGQNALMWAAGGNQPEIVDLLLAQRREEREHAREGRRLGAADDLRAARAVRLAADRRPHRPALCHALGLPALRAVAGQGRRRRQHAQSRRRDAAAQCARQQAL